MDVRYRDLVPEEYQDELIAIRDRSTSDSWRIGDITNEIISVCTVQYPLKLQTAGYVYQAVGSFCGKKARTVRYYASLAKKYTPEIRERFSVLSFDHFRAAYQFSPENPLLLLEYAIRRGDEFGRPATVDDCEAAFMYPGTQQRDPDDCVPQVPQAEFETGGTANRSEQDSPSRVAMERVRFIANELSEVKNDLDDMLVIDSSLSVEIEHAIGSLNSIVDRLSKHDAVLLTH